MNIKEKLLVLGGGGHAKSCIDVIESTRKYDIYGIIDNNIKGEVLGYKVLGGDDILKNLACEVPNAFVAVGQIKSTAAREKLYVILKNLGYNLPSIISPIAYISRSANVGEGSIIMHHALLNSGVKIGKMCIINTKALIEHGSEIGDFCHISTGAIVNGDTEIGQKSFIGSNMIIKHNVKIKENSVLYINPLDVTTNTKILLGGG